MTAIAIPTVPNIDNYSTGCLSFDLSAESTVRVHFGPTSSSARVSHGQLLGHVPDGDRDTLEQFVAERIDELAAAIQAISIAVLQGDAERASGLEHLVVRRERLIKLQGYLT